MKTQKYGLFLFKALLVSEVNAKIAFGSQNVDWKLFCICQYMKRIVFKYFFKDGLVFLQLECQETKEKMKKTFIFVQSKML